MYDGSTYCAPMTNFSPALELICKHEGFNEKAYADPETGDAPIHLVLERNIIQTVLP